MTEEGLLLEFFSIQLFCNTYSFANRFCFCNLGPAVLIGPSHAVDQLICFDIYKMELTGDLRTISSITSVFRNICFHWIVCHNYSWNVNTVPVQWWCHCWLASKWRIGLKGGGKFGYSINLLYFINFLNILLY